MGKLRFRRVSAKGWWYLGGTATWPRVEQPLWYRWLNGDASVFLSITTNGPEIRCTWDGEKP